MPIPFTLRDPTKVTLTEKEIAFAIRRLGGSEGVRRFNRGEEIFPLEEVTRRVPVDRKRTPWQALAATSRNQVVVDGGLNPVPRGEGREAEVLFFKIHCFMGDDHLEMEYEKRNCIPADLYSIAAVNEEDMTFADDRPNLTHWKGPDGKWYRLIFDRRESVRRVQVVCNDIDVDGPVWAACSPCIIEIPLSPSEFVPSDPLDGR